MNVSHVYLDCSFPFALKVFVFYNTEDFILISSLKKISHSLLRFQKLDAFLIDHLFIKLLWKVFESYVHPMKWKYLERPMWSNCQIFLAWIDKNSHPLLVSLTSFVVGLSLPLIASQSASEELFSANGCFRNTSIFVVFHYSVVHSLMWFNSLNCPWGSCPASFFRW